MDHIPGSRNYARARRKLLRQRAADDAAIRDAARADAFVAQFVGMTPAEVAAYVDANLVDLASAKLLIKKMALMLLLLARREYLED